MSKIEDLGYNCNTMEGKRGIINVLDARHFHRGRLASESAGSRAVFNLSSVGS